MIVIESKRRKRKNALKNMQRTCSHYIRKMQTLQLQ